MTKKLSILIVSLLILGLLYSLSQSITNYLRTGYRIRTAEEEVALLEAKNNTLKQKLQDSETVEFIEQQARDKLNMARPGETVFIIPQSEIDKVVALDKKEEPVREVLPNWKGWLRLFFP